jgi:hypothetical protein
MRILNAILFYGYAIMLLLIGSSGIFIAEWELKTFFHLRLEAMDGESHATLLNQYRFLKSMELGFGAFALLFRKEIFAEPKFNRFFLAILFAGVGARLLSMIIDGQPQMAYFAFTALELITGAVVFQYSKKTLVRT